MPPNTPQTDAPHASPNRRHFLFPVASTREPGHVGNTEWLARQTIARAAMFLEAGSA